MRGKKINDDDLLPPLQQRMPVFMMLQVQLL